MNKNCLNKQFDKIPVSTSSSAGILTPLKPLVNEHR